MLRKAFLFIFLLLLDLDLHKSLSFLLECLLDLFPLGDSNTWIDLIENFVFRLIHGLLIFWDLLKLSSFFTTFRPCDSALS